MPLQDWPRPFYQRDGGDPFLFYVVYGAVDLASPLSIWSYRSEGVSDGVEIMHYASDQHTDVLSSFREGYLWESLLRDAPDFAARIASATECVVVRGTLSDPITLNYFRDVVGLLTHFLDHGGLCIYDPQMFQWWQPQVWQQRVFAPSAAVPRHHVVILTSPEEVSGHAWIHTRGLRKFGRPDLSIHDVPISAESAIIDLCNRLIEQQAFGATIPEGQPIQMKSLPEGLICHHAGHADDPEFNNSHVEIRWPTRA